MSTYLLRHALLGTVYLCALALSCAAGAQSLDAQKSFHIASQPLVEALILFSQVSNIQVISAGQALKSMRVQAVEGVMAPRQALDKMLAGTGLRWRKLGDGSVVVEAVSAAEVPQSAAPHSTRAAATRHDGQSLTFMKRGWSTAQMA
jgi:iron complex outermembrane receptor protein